MVKLNPKIKIQSDDPNVNKKVFNYIQEYGIITDATLPDLNNYGDPGAYANKIIDPIKEYLINHGINCSNGGGFFKDTGFGAIYWLYDNDVYETMEAYNEAHKIAKAYMDYYE